MHFSLILSTVDRTDEFDRFLKSLKRQSFKDFELIVVDQNEGDLLLPVLDKYRNAFTIKHLRSERGLSRARNVGLQEIAGEIIAFPDDDCVYPEDLLSNVYAFFENHPEYGGLTGRAVTLYDATKSAWRFDEMSGALDKSNIFERTVSFTIFMRSEIVKAAGGFDVNLGVGAGTVWGSGEESDYLLRCMEADASIYYDFSLAVMHPEMTANCDIDTIKKGYKYGRGMVLVLRRHKIPLVYVLYRLLRSVGGALLSISKLQPMKAGYYMAMLIGRIQGYMDDMAYQCDDQSERY